ncbi:MULTISPECIES: hypothetical protein [Streptomyces]|uniref:hypothetical protein n=1 Tax=Streptomyces TaxID=1883 RepID=UPI00131ED005
MHRPRVTAASFIGRVLPDPYEVRLGGPDPEALHLLAAVHADFSCPPTGHQVSWQDCYDAA